MSADEGGLGARVRQVIGRHVAFEVSESAGRRRVLCGGCTWSDRPLAELDRPSRESHCDHLTAVLVEAIASEVDRLTRERDEARLLGGAEALEDAARAIYNGAGDPEQALYNECASPWLEKRALRLRAALGDDGTRGPEDPARAADRRRTTAEGHSSPAPPADWTYDSAAVRPTEHDDEGEKR